MAASVIDTSTALRGTDRPVERDTVAGAPTRIAAFLFELEALFDAASLDTALARATARAVAGRSGADPLWLEVLALEAARRDGGRAAQELLRSATGADPRHEVPARILASLRPAVGTRDLMRSLRRRFKLGVVSSRPREETVAVLRAVGLVDAFGAAGIVSDRARVGSSADVCEQTLALLGEPASRCVLVGRLGSPLLGAGRYAGMTAVAVEAAGPCRRASRRCVSDADLILPALGLIEGLAAGID